MNDKNLDNNYFILYIQWKRQLKTSQDDKNSVGFSYQ